MNFSKYHGTGNDFVLIDDREEVFSATPARIQTLCHRRYGIGADGVVLLGLSEKGDYTMRIFNRDGSEAEMCGNGLRCLIQFLLDLGIQKETFLIETQKKNYPCHIKNGAIFVDMGVPTILQESPLELFLEVGVPHFVKLVEDLSLFDQEAKKEFSRLGVNINYAMLGPCGTLRARTFERGVEQETFSCGSGATAVCMAAWKHMGVQGDVNVEFASGESLPFVINVETDTLKGIEMSGDVSHVFSGKVRL